MEKRYDTAHQDTIVCPYCGDRSFCPQLDYDNHKDTAEIECDECGEEFDLIVNVSITYTTKKKN